MAKRYLGQDMLVVGPSIKTGMPIRYDNPYEVGADRLAMPSPRTTVSATRAS